MTNLSIDHHRPEPEAERPDLSDVLGMVARLGDGAVMGRDGRRISLALSAVDVESLEGLVIDGEVYAATWRQSWAACGCRDGKHDWKRDNAWFGRSNWHETRTDAEAMAARIQGHLVTQLTAYTPMEVVQP